MDLNGLFLKGKFQFQGVISTHYLNVFVCFFIRKNIKRLLSLIIIILMKNLGNQVFLFYHR